MLDWPGLLKWTLANSGTIFLRKPYLTYIDGTTLNKDLAPMSEEDKKFLQEAFEHYSVDESKRMKEIVAELSKPENKDDPKDEEKRINMLLDLEELVEGLENARDLVRMGIWGSLVNLMLNSIYPEVRKALFFIFASCNSNNTFVQETSLQLGAMQLINHVIKEEGNVNKEAAFAALSSLVRGESLLIKRRFINIEGVEFLLELLRNDAAYSSNKIRTKAFSLLGDLVFYDDKLTYTSIAEYNKDGGSGKMVNDKPTQHVSLKKDNKEEEKQSELAKKEAEKTNEDLAKYKNIVKNKLIAQGVIDLGLKYLNKNDLKAQSDLRTFYYSLVCTLIEYDPKCKPSKDYFNKLSAFAIDLDKESKSQDNYYENELKTLNQLISLE